MKRMTFRSLITALVPLVLLCVPSIASADGGVTWNLSGVVFDDGGTASGSFIYDAITNTVSSIDIVTTAGTTFGSTTYGFVDPGFAPGPSEIVLVPNNSLVDFTGTLALDLSFASPLTNLGGTISLGGLGSEDLCGDAGCTFAADSPFRIMTAGEVVGTPVATPEPSVLLLLGMGLVGLVGAARRKVLQA